ncbi:hypothetical protein BH20ACT2_BH20ACT2_15340 [soil metagenome]
MDARDDRADDELDLRDYLAVLRRRKWIVVLCTVVVVGAALGVSLLQTPIYRSSAEVLLQPLTSEQLFSPGAANRTPELPEVATEIEVMRSRLIRSAVTDALGFEPDVSIRPEGETRVVTISAEDPDPTEAALVADTYAEVYVSTRRQTRVEDLLAAASQIQAQIDLIDEELAGLGAPFDPEAPPNTESRRASLQSRRDTYAGQLDALQLGSQLTQTGGAQIVSSAVVSSSPVSPTPERNAVVALALGLILGAALAFGVDYLDDSIRSKEDLERAAGGVVIIGLVPRLQSWKNRRETHLVTVESPMSAPAEAYRTLRTSLQFVGIERQVGITQITSPHSGDGKTTTLTNLGVALARAGQRVVLVDCDLRRPRLHAFFGLANEVGFTSVLLEEVTVAEAIQVVADHPNLAVLASGPPPPNPSELLSSVRTVETLRLLASEADFVLVDSAPVLPVSDALVLARTVDSTLVVTAVSRTKKRDARRTFELLAQVDAPVIGTILNDVDASSSYDLGYGYGGYVYATREAARNGREPRERRPRSWRRNKGDADASFDRDPSGAARR